MCGFYFVCRRVFYCENGDGLHGKARVTSVAALVMCVSDVSKFLSEEFSEIV